VRRELGEDAVILSNKRLGPGRIEIVAAASDSMQALVEEVDRPSGAPRPSVPARERTRADEASHTESFQDFIRRQAPASAPRATGGQPASAPRSDRREASASALRATAGSTAEARNAKAVVAMYHEVSRANVPTDELPADLLEPIAAPVQPNPAVFRQGAARGARVASGATIAGQASPGSIDGAPARAAPPPAMRAPAPAATNGSAALPQAVIDALPIQPAATPAPPQIRQATAALQPVPSPLPPVAPARPQTAPLSDLERDDARVMAELRSLRAALSDRIAALESNIALNRPPATAIEPSAQRNPAATRVMTRMLMSGFSPDLARRVAAHAPSTGDVEAMDAWLHEVVAGNLRCAGATDGLLEGQGAIALVGPTGVGKTTTVAKLAARFAVRYGASQLGLVTLDSYRIGAHEQLRSYGRMLGVPMHIAQDGATLRELLASLQGKRLVLIDTCGLSQRDERMEEMLGTLSAARFNMQPIRRILLLNAASHSETLDEVARAWHAPDAAGAILTKLDEAARIGGPLDCVLRYRMMLFGLTNGQRVPEDWHPASARLIAHVALKPSTSPFALGDEEARAWSEQPQGSSLHA
jgi:flagellar biosynthesis protein FlhF